MTDSRPGEDVAAKMQHDADELEHDLHKLEDHISDAQKAAARRREDLDPDVVAGDWDQTRGTPGHAAGGDD